MDRRIKCCDISSEELKAKFIQCVTDNVVTGLVNKGVGSIAELVID